MLAYRHFLNFADGLFSRRAFSVGGILLRMLNFSLGSEFRCRYRGDMASGGEIPGRHRPGIDAEIY